MVPLNRRHGVEKMAYERKGNDDISKKGFVEIMATEKELSNLGRS